MRTCIGCGTEKPKKELVRVVRDPDGHLSVDLTGKKNGRGAYLCREKTCIEKAVKKKRISEALAERLTEEIDRLG